jgi:hypothetical protein
MKAVTIKPTQRCSLTFVCTGMRKGADFIRASRIARCLLLAFIFLTAPIQADCQIFRKFGGTVERIPIAFKEIPSQQQLLDQMKARTEAVTQLSSNVSVSMAGAPKIKGTLQIEFPDRMRMKAGLLGVSEMGVDVGSNSEQFWIWTRASISGQPPALYYANHESFQRSSIRKSIPLDPKWLIEGLGMIRFDPTDVHYGPIMAEGGRIKFFTVRQTATGPQTRVMLLAAGTGLIEQQALYDASNQLIAYTDSSKFTTITKGDRRVNLPQRIKLHMVQPNGQDAEMVIDLSSISLEPLYGDPDRMWSMPNPKGVKMIDLGQAPPIAPRSSFNPISPAQRGTRGMGVGYQR